MEPIPRTVLYYKTINGREPFREWFSELRDKRIQQKIDIRLARIALGNLGDCRSVGGGLFELRIDWGPGYRIYFGQLGNHLIVLLAGGDKQSQFKDIEKAKTWWTGYRSVL